MRSAFVMIACLAACAPNAKPAERPESGECASCDVRFILEDKVDLVTLEHVTVVLDGRVVFRSVRWDRYADVGPVHVASGTHVARVLLVYRKDAEAYDVRSEHEFNASEGLVLRVTPKQGGSSIAPMSERIGVAWEEMKVNPKEP